MIDILSDPQLDATTLKPRNLTITTQTGRVLAPNVARLVDSDGDGDRDLVLTLPRSQLQGIDGPITIRVAGPKRELGANAVPGREGSPTSGFSLQSAPTDEGSGDSPTSGFVVNQYIVVFKDGFTPSRVESVADRMIAAYRGSVIDTYESALQGFAAQLTPQAARKLSLDPRVGFVEQDQIVTTATTQNNAPWGLDRIDQASLPLSSTYSYTATGAGVTAYIIDTGIRITHQEFGGRASYGYDFVQNDTTAADGNGHGTHVAATVGGTTYGVAKGVHLVAVRVLNSAGSGTVSGVVAGINWVTANHSGPSVANMSLGGGASTAIDDAVNNSISSGVTYVVAAGNDGALASNYSPARVGAALTVGATDSTDTKPSWSNYGSAVDVFAPGVNITSAWKNTDTATKTISGTSMATPHVTGVVALYLATNPTATTTQVHSAIVNMATAGAVKNAGTGSPNRLLYKGAL